MSRSLSPNRRSLTAKFNTFREKVKSTLGLGTIRKASKRRRLVIDKLEERQLLSLAPADFQDVLINEPLDPVQYGADVYTDPNPSLPASADRVVPLYMLYHGDPETLAAHSLAADNDGDFVATWTQQDEIRTVSLDASGYVVRLGDAPVYVPAVDPVTRLPIVDSNVYARYFTDEVQRITLPAGVLTNATGAYARFGLTYGNEVQKLSFSATYEPSTTATFGQLPIEAQVVLGFDVDGDGSIGPAETTTFFFNETNFTAADLAQRPGAVLETQLQNLGGALADVQVQAVNPHEYLIQFGTAAGSVNQPQISVESVNFSSGFLPTAIVTPVQDPVTIANIPVVPTDANQTAQAIENYFHQLTATTYTIGPWEFPPANQIPQSGPEMEPISLVTAAPNVTAVPVLGLTNPIDGSSMDGLVFDITFGGPPSDSRMVDGSGKKDHPQLVIASVRNEAGGLLTSAVVETRKQSSPVFRVNPIETDNVLTPGVDVMDQTHPSVAMDADGDFVIAWESEVSQAALFGSVSDIYARRFSPMGMVDDPTSVRGMLQDANGNYIQGVRTWIDEVQVLTFHSPTSTRISGAFRLRVGDNLPTNVIEFDSAQLVNTAQAMEAALAAAGFAGVGVEAISSSNPYQFKVSFGGPSGGVDQPLIQFVADDGSSGIDPLPATVSVGAVEIASDDSTFRVNTTTLHPQFDPAIGMDANGNFTIAWANNAQDFSFFNGINMQRFDRYGQPIGAETPVHPDDTAIYFHPFVGMSADGYTVVTWTRTVDPNYLTGGGYVSTVAGSAYNAAGVVVPGFSNIALNVGADDSAVAFDSAGNFIITGNEIFDADNNGGNSMGVQAIMYRPDGSVLRPAFRVNSAQLGTGGATLWPGPQILADPALDADGDLIVAYEGYGPDVSDFTFLDATYFQNLLALPENADLAAYFPGFLAGTDIDVEINDALINAQDAGASDDQLGRLRALLDQVAGLLRGEGYGILFSRYDADPTQPGQLDVLSSDSVLNAYRDGHNAEFLITIDRSTSTGDFVIRLYKPWAGFVDVTIAPVYVNNVMDIGATRDEIENKLQAELGTNWPEPDYGGTVDVDILNFGFGGGYGSGTYWDIAAIASPTDVVYRVTFQGEAHDADTLYAGLDMVLWSSDLEGASVSEVQQLVFDPQTTTQGWFALAIGGATTADIMFNPANLPGVAAAIENALQNIQVGAAFPYAGVQVTTIPGGPPYSFQLVFGGVSSGVNQPPVGRGVPTATTNLYDAQIYSFQLQAGGTDTAVPPGVREYVAGDLGTMQTQSSLAMQPDGSFVSVWTQYERYTDGTISNNNLYSRRFIEQFDSAGPRLTGLMDDSGRTVDPSGSISGAVRQVIVTIDEALMTTGVDSVTNPANWRLLKNGVELVGGIVDIEYGMNRSQDFGLGEAPTNKWEVVLSLDGNGLAAGTSDLSPGIYTVVAITPSGTASGIRDVAGNALGKTGYVPNGASMSFAFTVSRPSGGGLDTPIVPPPTGSGGAVNARTYAETPGAVAVKADGDYVVVWSAAVTAADPSRVYYQLFDADGTPADMPLVDDATGEPIRDASGNILIVTDSAPILQVAPEELYAQFLADDQLYSSVAIDKDGDFVVTWSNGRDTDGNTANGREQEDVYVRRFNAMGAMAGVTPQLDAVGNPILGADGAPVYKAVWDGPELHAPILVNTATAGSQKWSGAAMDVAGNFVVAWSSFGQDGSGYGVYAQRFDLFGQKAGAEIKVSTTTSGNQSLPSAAMDASGRFVIVWNSDPTGSNSDVLARTFDASGAATSGEIALAGTTIGHQKYPDVAMDLAGDNMVVTWSSAGQDGDGYGVYARRFARAGGTFAPAAAEFQVNTTTASDQLYSSVAMSHQGDFALTWSGRGEQAGQVDTSGFGGIYVRRYDRTGAPVAGQPAETRVNSVTDGSQWLPSVSMDGEGNYVVVWTGEERLSGLGVTRTNVFASASVNVLPVTDLDGPLVGEVTLTDGTRVIQDDVISADALLFDHDNNPATADLPAMRVIVDEMLSTAGMTSGVNSVLNPVNWRLSQNGINVTNGVNRIAFQWNPLSRKYEATVVLDGNGLFPGVENLSAGRYVLTMRDVITDGANKLDSDYNGVPGSPVGSAGYTFSFVVTADVGQSETPVNQETAPDQQFAEPQGTGTGAEQSNGTIAVDHDGDYVSVWTSYNQAEVGADVYVRAFDRNDVPLTDEILVNGYLPGNQRNASVAIDADGDFVVVWESQGQDPDGTWGIYGRRFTSMGLPVGDEFRVNTTMLYDQLQPSVAMNNRGDFVVGWSTAGTGYGWLNDIRAQAFSYTGDMVGTELQVSTPIIGVNTASGVTPNNVSVAISGTTGEFAVAWDSVTASLNGVVMNTNVMARQYNADTTPKAAAFVADTGVGTGGTVTNRTARNPSAAMQDNGNLFVAWESFVGADYGVYYQRFDNAGASTGTGLASDPQFTGHQVNPSVSVDANGNFVVAWNGAGGQPDAMNPGNPAANTNLDEEGVFFQRFTSTLAASGVETRANVTEGGVQQFPAAGLTRDGDLVIAWSGRGMNDRQGIFSRRFSSLTDTVGPLVSDLTTPTQQTIPQKGVVMEPVTYLVVTFDENMFDRIRAGDPVALDGVTNLANYHLLRNGTELTSVIKSITFGLNEASSQISGYPATNKYEAVLVLDSDPLTAARDALTEGHYRLIVSKVLRDLAGNKLGVTVLAPNTTDYTHDFDVLLPADGESRVNGPVAGGQYTNDHTAQSVATDYDGDYVVVWTSTAAGSEGVYAKLYDATWRNTAAGRTATYQVVSVINPATGQPWANNEIRVTDAVTASNASVARDADGDFVVTWSQIDTLSDPQSGIASTDYNVWAQRFNSVGKPLGNNSVSTVPEPWRVNAHTLDHQRYSAVAMDAEGDFTIVWQSNNQDGSGYGVYGQRYTPSAAPVGGVDEVQVLDFTGSPKGTFALSWDPDNNPATLNSRTTADIAYTGNAFTSVDAIRNALMAIGLKDIDVQATSTSQVMIHFGSSMGSKNQGMVTVARKNLTPLSSNVTASTRVDGVPGEFLVNQTTLNNQTAPSIAMDAEGDFVVAWQSAGQNGDAATETNVYVRRFVATQTIYGAVRSAITPYQAPNPNVKPKIITVDDPGYHVVQAGSGYDGVVEINVDTPAGEWSGSGTMLLTGRHILTAAHVVTFDRSANPVSTTDLTVTFSMRTGDVKIPVSEIFVNPAYNGNTNQGGDVAILVLANDAPVGVDRHDIYRNTDELNRITNIYGYGYTGQGDTGQILPGGTKRYGQNRYEAIGTDIDPAFSPDILVYDFDNGNPVNDAMGNLVNRGNLGLGNNEVNSAEGDSGGPIFINGLIAGVTSFGYDVAGNLSDVTLGIVDASFGEFSFDTRVSSYATWIDAVTLGGGAEAPATVVTAGSQKWPSVAMDEDGDFVVSWTGDAANALDLTNIYARRFDTQTNPLGAQFQVNTFVTGSQDHSGVAMDADGDFTVTWQSLQEPSATGATYGVYAQRYARASLIGLDPNLGVNGEIGSELHVNTTTNGPQRYPSIAMDGTGDTVIVWNGNGEGDSVGVYQQRYEKATDDAGPIVADVLNVAAVSGVTALQLVREGTVLDGPAKRFVIDFGEDLIKDLAGNTAWLQSIKNPANWTLSLNGQTMIAPIVSIQFGLDQAQKSGLVSAASGKFQAVITFDSDPTKTGAQALEGGTYELTIRDTVRDPFANRIDGNYDGIAATDFHRQFRIVTTGSTDQELPGGPGTPAEDSTDIAVNPQFPPKPPLLGFENGQQDSPAIAMAADGSFVAVWVTYGQTEGQNPPLDQPTEGNIIMQRFNRYGQKEGKYVNVSSYTIGSQVQPAVAMDPAGNFIVVWSGKGATDISGAGIYARLFDSLGAPKGVDFQVNQFTTNNQVLPSVAADGSGNFVVTWCGYGNAADTNGVWARRFTASGTARGGEFLVNTMVTAVQERPDVAMDDAGNFTIVWQTEAKDGSALAVCGQKYDANGAKVGGEFTVNQHTESRQYQPRVAMDADGDYTVTWTSFLQDGSGYGVYARRYSKANVALSNEFLVNKTTDNFQWEPDVAMSDRGDIVIVWSAFLQDNAPPTRDYGIFARMYNPDGSDFVDRATGQIQGEFRINAAVLGNQVLPAVAMDADGDLAAIWVGPDTVDLGAGTASTDIFGRMMAINPIAPITSVPGADTVNRFDGWSGGWTAPQAAGGVVNATYIYGTANNDTIEVDLSGGPDNWTVKVNGVNQAVPTGAPVLAIDGRSGNDTVTIKGTSGREMVTMRPDGTVVDTNGYLVQTSNTEVVNFEGNEGGDGVSMFGSAAADTLTAYPTEATMTGSGSAYSYSAKGFETLTAKAITGGTDRAFLYGTSAADSLLVSPTKATYTVGKNSLVAQTFRFVEAGGNGGADTVSFLDSSGADTLTVAGTGGTLTNNSTYSNKANDFRYIYSYATAGGKDTANLTDTAGTDYLTANPGLAILSDSASTSARGTTYFHRVSGYEVVNVSSRGGSDTATLQDSSVATTATSYAFTLDAKAKFGEVKGGAYSVRANSFPNVTATSLDTGADTATFYDSAADDRFNAFLSTNAANLVGTGFNYRTSKVKIVKAVSQNGGNDSAYLYDSAGNDTFTASPNKGEMVGSTGISISADKFRFIYGDASLAGNDTAIVTGGAGKKDYFVGSNSVFRLADAASGSTLHYEWGTGFTSVVANGQVADGDTATLSGSTGADTFTSDFALKAGSTTVRDPAKPYAVYAGAGFSNTVNNFRIIKGTGDVLDIAHMYAATSADVFTGWAGKPGTATPTTFSTMNGTGFNNRVDGFGEVRGHGVRGTTGTSTANLNDKALHVLLEADQNWAKLSNLDTSTGPFKIFAEDFEKVVATATAGNQFAKKSIKAVDFVLEMPGPWKL